MNLQAARIVTDNEGRPSATHFVRLDDFPDPLAWEYPRVFERGERGDAAVVLAALRAALLARRPMSVELRRWNEVPGRGYAYLALNIGSITLHSDGCYPDRMEGMAEAAEQDLETVRRWIAGREAAADESEARRRPVTDFATAR